MGETVTENIFFEGITFCTSIFSINSYNLCQGHSLFVPDNHKYWTFLDNYQKIEEFFAEIKLVNWSPQKVKSPLKFQDLQECKIFKTNFLGGEKLDQ